MRDIQIPAMGKKKNRKGKISVLGIVILVILFVGTFLLTITLDRYFTRYKKNIVEDYTLYVRPGTDFGTLLDSLTPRLKKVRSFVKTAEKEQLPGSIKPGRYVLTTETTNIRLVRSLKYGYQDPIMLPISTAVRNKKGLASRLSARLCADSAEFMAAFTDLELLDSVGVDTNTFLSLFIPDSYEVFWTITPAEFLRKMKDENDKFWAADDRLKKAEDLKLTPAQVSILASIVNCESNYVPEYPQIASVYLNRLRKGWKLCADPTVVFANGDFKLGRVLKKHLNVDSPYNTYKYYGLPPGPIKIANKDGIDGVLNADKTEYMYFCASPKRNGTHLFARTGAEHLRNAKAFHKVLDSLQRAKRLAAKNDAK